MERSAAPVVTAGATSTPAAGAADDELGDQSGFDLVLQNPDRYGDLRLRELRSWLLGLLRDLAPERRSFGVLFSSNRTMRSLNLRHRGRDAVTDVLSFPGDEEHLGDVVVAVPVARAQSAEGRDRPGRELRRLLLHGVLHCLGYDHETDDGEMDRLEDELRLRYLESVNR